MMTVSVALEHRFLRLPDGSVWTQVQCAWPFWQRYLDVFDHVRCVARVREVVSLKGEWHRADGPGVSFSALPHYVGPAQFLRQLWRLRAAVDRSLRVGDAVVLRVPGNVAGLAYTRLESLDYPFGVEVVGDPYDVLAPGSVHHPLRAFFRWHITRQLKRHCARACAASYVTARALQRRYPSTAFTISASSIDLGDDAFAAAPRVFAPGARPSQLLFVGSLQHYHKAPDLLIRADAQCVNAGHDLALTLVGDGKRRRDLEVLAAQLGCRERVVFVGQLPSSAVGAQLDRADIFVLPSRHEGLPRAMIEAMARGLPCIGSDVAGIPELLPAGAIVPSGDLQALANKIRQVAADPVWMTEMSARNLDEARMYRATVLQQRRVGFYRRVREATEAWLRDHHTSN
jgi:glycosyltransferase involved in cell wall biosynthesis